MKKKLLTAAIGLAVTLGLPLAAQAAIEEGKLVIWINGDKGYNGLQKVRFDDGTVFSAFADEDATRAEIARIAPEDLAKERSFGIRGLHERAETVGGWVDLSSKPGVTSLILSVPLSGPENGFIDRLLPPLCARLQAAGRGARRVRLTLKRTDGRAEMREVGRKSG